MGRKYPTKIAESDLEGGSSQQKTTANEYKRTTEVRRKSKKGSPGRGATRFLPHPKYLSTMRQLCQSSMKSLEKPQPIVPWLHLFTPFYCKSSS